jgi:Zn-dependent protease with chaperone function
MHVLTVILFFICGIAIIILSWWSGERKNLIDQTESDGRIFLLIILMMGIYFLFFSTTALYLMLYLSTARLIFLAIGIYFLVPGVLGTVIYCLIPRICEKNMDLSEQYPHEEITSLVQLLDLESSPVVRYTDQKIPPYVYGRRGKSSMLVYPHHMDLFLTYQERKAVLIHELSHIKQGDVGFFTWLTLLLDGLKYWILFYPFIFLGPVAQFSIYDPVWGVPIIIPLLIIPLFLLKQSLSRTRESIADAYAIFHGLDTSLASALYKYNAFHLTVHSISSRLWFHNPSTRFPFLVSRLLASHPSFQKRLNDMKTRALLKEKSANLSTPLAIWTGMTAALLFYTFNTGIINILVVTVYEISDIVSEMMWVGTFWVVASTTALSYIFPPTKSALYFSDLGQREILLPLIRNWGLTMSVAGCIFYCLSGSWIETRLLLSMIVGGIFLWIMGFASSRPTDFSTNTGYIIWGPIIWGCLLLFPAYSIRSLFFDTTLISIYFLESLFRILLLLLLFSLIFILNGYVRFSRPERFLFYFRKRREWYWMSDLQYTVFTPTVVFSIPSLLSLGIYAGSQWVASQWGLLPSFLVVYGSAAILVIYGIWKSEMLFFRYIAYLTDILPSPSLSPHTVEFIENVIEEYQSEDGGFDYAGLGFSNQEDTFHMLSTAKSLHIAVDNQKIMEWMRTTEDKKGGFSAFSGGLPRIEATYFALRSLHILGSAEISPVHIRWINSMDKGMHFAFPYDTCSALLQTCYAVISLSLLQQVPENVEEYEKLILDEFSLHSTPQEAYYVGLALKCLDRNNEKMQKWIEYHRSILSTRLDKNVIPLYYYVKTCKMYQQPVPSLITEQAKKELEALREKYEDSVA